MVGCVAGAHTAKNVTFPDISCYSNVMKFHLSCTIKVPGGIIGEIS